MKKASPNKTAVGRPPKFNEVRRPVTVTLPQRILDLLATVNADRARAIARVTEAAIGTEQPAHKRVQLVEIGTEQCVVMIGQSEQLRRIPWLRLVEIAPARNLLIIPLGTPIETLEVSLSDLIEDATTDPKEKVMLDELKLLISRMRRQGKIFKGEILFFAAKPTTHEAQQ